MVGLFAWFDSWLCLLTMHLVLSFGMSSFDSWINPGRLLTLFSIHSFDWSEAPLRTMTWRFPSIGGQAQWRGQQGRRAYYFIRPWVEFATDHLSSSYFSCRVIFQFVYYTICVLDFPTLRPAKSWNYFYCSLIRNKSRCLISYNRKAETHWREARTHHPNSSWYSFSSWKSIEIGNGYKV